MSEQKNTNSVSKADKKLDKSLKGLSGKQRQQAAATKKEARKWKMYGIATIVVVALIAALLFWDSGFIQRRAAAVKIGERSYSAAEVDYYYYSIYDNMYAYASYYGLDPNKSVKEQEIYEGTTWYQYLCDNAKNSLTNVSTLAQEAKAAGYEMTEETQAKIDEEIAETKKSAKENNVSYSFYLKRIFGRMMTPSVYKKVVTEYEYAYAYEDYKTESYDVSDADIESYYDENRNTIDTYDYIAYRVNAMPDEEDENGEEKTLTAEDYTAAAKDAKALADALLKEMKEGSVENSELISDDRVSDFSDITASSLSGYTFGEWLQDSARKEGDTTLQDETTKVKIGDAEEETEVTQYYFVTKFEKRYLDEYKAGSVETILVTAEGADDAADYGAALAEAEKLKQQFEAGDKTEDAFHALTEEAETAEDADEADDADESAEAEEEENKVNTELQHFDSAAKTSISDALADWMYGTTRQDGDVDIIQDTEAEGYRLVYFKGYDDELCWRKAARATLQSKQYQEWMDGLSETYKAEETSFFSYVG